MDIGQAHGILAENSREDTGSFYGGTEGLALGAGLILSKVQFPQFDGTKGKFVVWEGLVLILSHECDIDQENDRVLNDLALVCPVRGLEALVEQAEMAGYDDSKLATFLANLAARQVSRVVYFPPIGEVLPFGGFIYLNQLTHTAVGTLLGSQVARLAALSAYGARSVDYALERHFFREKSDSLPLSAAPLRRGISINSVPKKT